VGVLLLSPPAAAQVQSPQAWQFVSINELLHMPPYSGETRNFPDSSQPANKSFLLFNFGEKLLTVKSALMEQPPADQPKPAFALAPKPAVVRMLANSSIIEQWLDAEAELAYSSPDTGTLSGIGEDVHRLLRMKIKGTAGGMSYGAEYRWVGRDFMNVGGPGFAQNQQGLELWSERKLGPIFGVKTFLSRFTDNTAADPYQAFTTRTIGGANLSVVLPAWPTLNVFYSGGLLATSHEPDGMAPQRGTLQNAGAQLVYGRSGWEMAASSAFAFNNLASRGASAVQTHTPVFSLGFKYQPLGLPLQANAFGSYTKTKASDISSDNNEFALSAALSWNLGVSRFGKTTLIGGGGFNRRADLVDPTASHKEASAWVRFKIDGF
jgi:hypothetical protein